MSGIEEQQKRKAEQEPEPEGEKAKGLIHLLREYYNAKKQGGSEFKDPDHKGEGEPAVFRLEDLEKKGEDGKSQIENWEKELKKAS